MELKKKTLSDGELTLRFHAVRTGKVFVRLAWGGEARLMFHLYAHPTGILTYETYFENCDGAWVIPAALLLFFAAALWTVAADCRASMRRSLYQYRNVLLVAWTIFLGFLLLDLAAQLFAYNGLLQTVNRLLSAARGFSLYVLPATFVLSVLVTVNSLTLMRREGRSWRNMLGVILGLGLCLLTLLPVALGEFLQRTTLVDVHNERGLALYVERFTEAFVSAVASYLICLLAGTVFCAVKAARHVPPFDRDYILIHGCQLMPDGSLTPLLRGRADRALAFAARQEEQTGWKPVFVPSGGKGADEVTAEADAIAAYLRERGVPADRILPEDQSVNTEENIRNAMALIRAHAGGKKPNVAFSTTNYHVFRAGLIAFGLGESLEGMGSPTKRYFWINAFVREFVATLVSERKRHAAVLLSLAAAILGMVLVEYLAAVI